MPLLLPLPSLFLNCAQAIAGEVLRLQLEEGEEPRPLQEELGGLSDSMLKVGDAQGKTNLKGPSTWYLPLVH